MMSKETNLSDSKQERRLESANVTGNHLKNRQLSKSKQVWNLWSGPGTVFYFSCYNSSSLYSKYCFCFFRPFDEGYCHETIQKTVTTFL